MLTPASDEAKDLSQLCQGRFTGDPSHEFEITKYNITNEDTEDENVEEYKVRETSKEYQCIFSKLSLVFIVTFT